MFVYQGSKRLELKQIRECEPKVAFRTFVDVFGGAGNVYLDYLKRFPNVICIYNDFDECLSNIFKEVASGNAKLLDQQIEEMFSSGIRRDELITKIENGDEKKDSKNFLFLLRTAARGFWNAKQYCKLKNGIPALSPSSLQKYAPIVNNISTIHNRDYREEMNLYKNDETAFLYLDPPYNGKGTRINTYKEMTVGKFHNFLIFIEEFIKDPETKCKVMLNIDFQGDVYVRFRDLIKLVYPVKYSVCNQTKDDNKKVQQYHVIITNYE